MCLLLSFLRKYFSVRNYFTLPTLTEEGYRVTIGSLNNFNSDKFSLQALIRRILMILDIRLKEEVCLSNIMIIDLKVQHTSVIVSITSFFHVLFASQCHVTVIDDEYVRDKEFLGLYFSKFFSEN